MVEKYGQYISHKNYPALGAYITFNDKVDKVKCQKLFRNSKKWFGKKAELTMVGTSY